jgi:hypothetical protein
MMMWQQHTDDDDDNSVFASFSAFLSKQWQQE